MTGAKSFTDRTEASYRLGRSRPRRTASTNVYPSGGGLRMSGGDGAAGARLVLDHHRLAERGGRASAPMGARENVRRSAGRIRHDEADGLGRPRLRACERRQDCQGDGKQHGSGS